MDGWIRSSLEIEAHTIWEKSATELPGSPICARRLVLIQSYLIGTIAFIAVVIFIAI
jgi:hypothetical protein